MLLRTFESENRCGQRSQQWTELTQPNSLCQTPKISSPTLRLPEWFKSNSISLTHLQRFLTPQFMFTRNSPCHEQLNVWGLIKPNNNPWNHIRFFFSPCLSRGIPQLQTLSNWHHPALELQYQWSLWWFQFFCWGITLNPNNSFHGGLQSHSGFKHSHPGLRNFFLGCLSLPWLWQTTFILSRHKPISVISFLIIQFLKEADGAAHCKFSLCNFGWMPLDY